MKLERTIRRYNIIQAHREMVQKGQYEQARLLFGLLRKGSIRLGSRDNDWAVEMLCEKLGCHISYSHNYLSATVYA